MSKQVHSTEQPKENENQANLTNLPSISSEHGGIGTPTVEDVSKNEDVGTPVRLTEDPPIQITNAEERLPTTALSETVGDDFTKKSKVDIVCECEPNVAGAAVPAVKSFIPTEKQNSVIKCNTSNCKLSNSDLRQSSASTKRDSCLQKRKDLVKHVSRIRQKYRDDLKDKSNSNNINNKFKCGSHFLKNATTGKPDSDVKNHTKKPSMIPKPTRSSSISGKSLDSTKDGTEEQTNVQTDLSCKTDLKSATEKDFEKTSSNISTISSRVLSLQERLKATTSILRKKIEMDKSKEETPPNENSVESSAEEELDKNDCVPSKKTVDDLYKSISCLKDIATTLARTSTLKIQTKYIEKLLSHISEIKLIADKLSLNDQSKSKQDIGHSNSEILEKEKSSTTNEKDNKIYIKFMHAKDRKGDKRKSKELFPDQSRDVQTDHNFSSKMTQEAKTTDKSREENNIKEADSMDGVFIPSLEPPMNMEEDEETNGLDITITFPEFSQLYSSGTESHLSVCLSDISAEALRKLKRCPKDFTLKMDFVEGKVLFQSGRGPANNFQIGPDLKFSENFVDTKKSDVISIKPSTECCFGSQLIPVCENPKENKSCKSLKSVDSELFNVVSLPFLYKNPYLATSHKSCMAFRNDQIMSMAIMARHFYKSMPQIPSLTNIFEDREMESPSKTDTRKKTQEPSKPKKVD